MVKDVGVLELSETIHDHLARNPYDRFGDANFREFRTTNSSEWTSPLPWFGVVEYDRTLRRLFSLVHNISSA